MVGLKIIWLTGRVKWIVSLPTVQVDLCSFFFRPLVYSTLADLVHHVRQSLPMSELSMAVNLFSKNVHDESLLSSIQTMSCKLLLNLVDCIRQKSEQENGNVRTAPFKDLPEINATLFLRPCTHRLIFLVLLVCFFFNSVMRPLHYGDHFLQTLWWLDYQGFTVIYIYSGIS